MAVAANLLEDMFFEHVRRFRTHPLTDEVAAFIRDFNPPEWVVDLARCAYLEELKNNDD